MGGEYYCESRFLRESIYEKWTRLLPRKKREPRGISLEILIKKTCADPTLEITK
jgi:hypothetical protein